MKNISRFDLGMIIAFIVVAFLGAGAWWYLSGELVTAQGEVTAAAGDFDKFSKQQVYLPTPGNVKTLKNNIAVMTAQLDPLVKSTLQGPGNKLPAIQTIDTVTWKHNLDDEVRRLNSSAKLHGIDVPNNFYYGFSRYLDKNPAEEATAVLSRQQLAIEQIATILIDAPVRSILSVKRTNEEDPDASKMSTNGVKADTDMLEGSSIEAPGGVYTAYPFEVAFDTTTEGFRKVVDGLMQSPYVFVIRGLTVQNARLDSPKISDLDKMAGAEGITQPSLVNSSPGEVAARQAAPPSVGPQFLFGGETVRVRARIDLIEWHGVSSDTPAPSNTDRAGSHRPDNNG